VFTGMRHFPPLIGIYAISYSAGLVRETNN